MSHSVRYLYYEVLSDPYLLSLRSNIWSLFTDTPPLFATLHSPCHCVIYMVLMWLLIIQPRWCGSLRGIHDSHMVLTQLKCSEILALHCRTPLVIYILLWELLPTNTCVPYSHLQQTPPARYLHLHSEVTSFKTPAALLVLLWPPQPNVLWSATQIMQLDPGGHLSTPARTQAPLWQHQHLPA